MMKLFKTIKKLEGEGKEVHSVVSEDTEFSAKAVMFICYKIEELIGIMKSNKIEVKGNAKYRRIFWRFYFKI